MQFSKSLQSARRERGKKQELTLVFVDPFINQSNFFYFFAISVWYGNPEYMFIPEESGIRITVLRTLKSIHLVCII